MRRSGKTTRTIDEAIQTLFKEGEIWIPSKQGIKNFNESERFNKNEDRLKILSLMIIDPEWQEGRAQEDLGKRIAKRINSEHFDQCTYSKENEYLKIRLIK
jgi:hypothetical protein